MERLEKIVLILGELKVIEILCYHLDVEELN